MSLADDGFIERVGASRSTHYILREDFKSKEG